MVCCSFRQRYKNVPLNIRKFSRQSSFVNEPHTILSHHMKFLSLAQILRGIVKKAYVTATLRNSEVQTLLSFQAPLSCSSFAASCFDRHWNSTCLFTLFPHKRWEKTSNQTSVIYLSSIDPILCNITCETSNKNANKSAYNSHCKQIRLNWIELNDLRNRYPCNHVQGTNQYLKQCMLKLIRVVFLDLSNNLKYKWPTQTR